MFTTVSLKSDAGTKPHGKIAPDNGFDELGLPSRYLYAWFSHYHSLVISVMQQA